MPTDANSFLNAAESVALKTQIANAHCLMTHGGPIALVAVFLQLTSEVEKTKTKARLVK